MYNVYLISSEHSDGTYYKIGWTKRDPNKRLKELRTGNSHELNIVSVFESKWGPMIESNLHKHFHKFRCEGEWFKLELDQVLKFKEICQKNHDLFELVKDNSWVRSRREFSKYLN